MRVGHITRKKSKITRKYGEHLQFLFVAIYSRMVYNNNNWAYSRVLPDIPRNIVI